MKKDPVKVIIALGFSGVLVLMGLIAFISISRMHASIDELSLLLEQTNAKTTAANAMRDSIRLRGDTLYKMYLTDDFIEKDNYRLQLGQHGLDYKLARDRLYSYPMSARERKLLDVLMKKTRAAKALNDSAAELMLSDDDPQVIKQTLLDANLARHNMLAGLNRLVTLQDQNAKIILHDSQQYQNTITTIIILLSAASFFIAVLISLVVVRETSKKNTEIRYRASHDELTRLVNRKEFEHQLTDAFSQVQASHTRHALCVLDLDEFKIINDSCGHKAGDALLIQLSKRIKNTIRKHDTLARLGGDEFGLLLKDCSLEKAIGITEGIVSLVKNYEFNWENKTFHVGVSIGVAMIGDDTRSIKAAMHDADMACYAAKDMGKNQVQVHQLDDAHMKKVHKELSWVADVDNSIENNRFTLYIQAIKPINTDNTQPRYEVLLRLNDDEGTLVSPGAHIPIAERFNLMNKIDHWVIEETFRNLSQLSHAHPHNLPCIFINISENALTDPGFLDFIIRQYKKYNIQHDTVCLEISENTAIKNINLTADFIHALRKYNIRFALDHFGHSLSSIQYLKALPVDYLKIDGQIVKDISLNTANKALVAAINEVGKVMNIQTIAEHVEDAFTLNQLKEIGVTLSQGYYFSKPESINHLDALLEQAEHQQSGHRC